MYISDTHLKAFLADAGLVSAKDFDAAEKEAKESGKSVGDILTAKNTIGEDELRRTYANIIAYNRRGDDLEVAMLDTDDLAAIDFIKKKTHLKILARLTDVASIKSGLKQYQQGLKDNLGEVIRRETAALDKTPEGNALSTRFCVTRARRTLPTFTSNRSMSHFSFATASTASCMMRWNCRNALRVPSPRASKCSPT